METSPKDIKTKKITAKTPKKEQGSFEIQRLKLKSLLCGGSIPSISTSRTKRLFATLILDYYFMPVILTTSFAIMSHLVSFCE